jgi:signal transduction histidine kinase/ActR/RegA family two-component response regulator
LYFALAVLCIMATVLTIFMLRERATSRTSHSRLVARVARDALILAVERESAIRGFLITGDSASLQSEFQARSLHSAKLDSLVSLTTDNPAQQLRARAIETALLAWDDNFAKPALAGRLTVTGGRLAGQQLFDTFRLRFAEFVVAEEVLYEARVSRTHILVIFAQITFLLPISLLGVIFVRIGRRLAKQGDHVLQQQQQLEEQAIELEQQLEEMEAVNAELSETVTELRTSRDQAATDSRERDRANAFLDAALASTPIGLSLLDTNLRYIRVNEATTALTGIPVRYYPGRTMREVNSSVSPEIEKALRRVAETGTPELDIRMTSEAVQGMSARRELVLNVYPIRTATGETLGVGVSAADTTEHDVLQERFHQSQKLEAVGRLAAGVAHDFNNLLTVIRTYCDLVLLEISPSGAHYAELTEIHLAAERAGTLARQLLYVGRRKTLLPKLLDLNEVIHGVEAMLRHVTRSGVQLKSVLSHSLGLMRADPSQLEQVLVNLVINAVDAMPEGGEISIRTCNAELDHAYTASRRGVIAGPYVRLTVSDSGTGMSKETQERIFDPFFTTKDADKGTGLGLASVYGIVQQVRGHISVESELGKGTTFSIFFPREMGEEGSEPLRSRVTQEASSPTGKETVLIAEDDDALLASLTYALTRYGYTVLDANHGGAAMRLASEREERIDLLLTDLHMPGMDGRDLAKRIGAIHPETKVLFMSGSSGTKGTPIDRPNDSDAFIPKPFSVESLATKIREVLETPAGSPYPILPESSLSTTTDS